jgi:hypothetical protein
MTAPKGNKFAEGNGRPSLYKPDYDKDVIDCGSRGLSLTAFAGEIGVSRDTISEWMKVHESFSVACKASLAKRALFLETGMLKDDATGPMVTARRFALVNAAPDEWREKQALEHTGKNGGPIEHAVSKIEHTIVDPNATDSDS